MSVEGPADDPGQRLDRWLWAARFFKTRSLARKAVAAGHVELNDQPAKPAKAVAIGDRLTIRTPAGRYVVHVVALSERRGPAAEARALFRETPESEAAREREALERRQRRAEVTFDRGRPDRRQRRASIRFRRQDH